jgi:hypothetical protein
VRAFGQPDDASELLEALLHVAREDQRRTAWKGIEENGRRRQKAGVAVPALRCCSLRCLEPQRLLDSLILRGEPEPDDPPIRSPQPRRFGLELHRVAAVVAETKTPFGIRGSRDLSPDA